MPKKLLNLRFYERYFGWVRIAAKCLLQNSNECVFETPVHSEKNKIPLINDHKRLFPKFKKKEEILLEQKIIHLL